ncbi:MgtC/SapB family protein [Roseisolibacter sp. H3M3-2]|uniref:MgtC/SapB family protein n=1 Tax=Roseisolibacter sp. H3M3-2 TaxID=3031323 RepID=UPI0023DB0A43|nr:MgtC/SapB family protein [Roseisolibacter sp. H3M3-2]MDF1502758.1 MgtC/SapB family protein [Roseisolibacter sp. H3M3-2]
MDIIWQELSGGLVDGEKAARVAFRLVAAMLLGAVVGAERESAGQFAGLRTHILVALGAALLVVIPSVEQQDTEDVGRVIQGIATGIGFIGAGAVLKLRDREEIRGLTTAAAVWVTAAAGVASGLGFVGVAAIAVALTWVTLKVGRSAGKRHDGEAPAAVSAPDASGRSPR